MLERLATNAATTKRALFVDGKRQAASQHLTNLSCTDVTPVSEAVLSEVRNHTTLNAPYSLRQTIMVGDSHDIVAGDLFVVDSVEYIVVAVNVWKRRAGNMTRILMEEAA